MKDFFKGLSFTQILAGTLAAVTAFLLAARIGVAGTAIGVGVASAVSAIATQVYQNMLKASTEKIKDVTPFPPADDHETAGDHKEGDKATGAPDTAEERPEVNDSTYAETGVIKHDDTDVMSHTYHDVHTDTDVMSQTYHDVHDDDAKTRVDATAVHPTGVHEAPRVVSSEPNGGDDVEHTIPNTAHAEESTVPSGLHELDSHAVEAARADDKHKHTVIVVAVVSGLLALALTAAIVMLVTGGEGTDRVVRDLVDNSTVEPTQEPTQTPTETTTPTPEQTTSPSPTTTEPTVTSSPEETSPSPSPTDTDTSTTTPTPTPTESQTETPGNEATNSGDDADAD